VCANRIYVQDGVYDEFARRFAGQGQPIEGGRGVEPGVLIGPLIEQAAIDKVKSHVEDAVSKGAKVILGGAAHERGGLFFQPTVLTEVTPRMRVAREETFGPVAPLFRFKSEAEAVAMANDSEFGLAAYFSPVTLDGPSGWPSSSRLG
jgi:succinate-semialdehyde dehydrogenase/glutarate-semialdehyde dehydrogenase